MQKIFITATNTDIGKTHVTLKLLKYFALLGKRVAAIKPIETGVFSKPEDGTKLYNLISTLNPELSHLRLKDIVPIQYKLPAAPFVAKGEGAIDFGVIQEKIDAFADFCDVLLIEGAGGLMVPVDEEHFMIDFIELFGIDKTLLVTSSKLGSINDTLLSIEKLQSSLVDFSWAINLHEDKESFFEVTYPFYAHYFKKITLLDGDEGYQKLIEEYFFG